MIDCIVFDGSNKPRIIKLDKDVPHITLPAAGGEQKFTVEDFLQGSHSFFIAYIGKGPSTNEIQGAIMTLNPRGIERHF